MPLSPPVNGTEQRLDVLLAQQVELIGEVQGLRAEIQALKPPEPAKWADSQLGEPPVVLREPTVSAPPKPKPRRKPKPRVDTRNEPSTG